MGQLAPLRLVDEGYAYPCFCTDKELTMMKEKQEVGRCTLNSV
jgi:glutamyl/glutaminyl-tRNA synthetase